jgi:peroxiredoxin
MTRKILGAAAVLGALALPLTAFAELPQGATAPMFATQGALAGKEFAFDLRAALRRGPVVLYFYPKAFTQGCTLEAHAFAEAANDFRRAGATVIGLSNDDLPTLQRFSTEACRSQFPVAVATPQIIRSYDVALRLPPAMAAKAASMPQGLANRTSYVIAPNGRISLVYTNLDYRDHVRNTLAAVRAMRRR